LADLYAVVEQLPMMAPHNALAVLMRRLKLPMAALILGRPGPRDRQRLWRDLR
jgi:hypothetical protein